MAPMGDLVRRQYGDGYGYGYGWGYSDVGTIPDG